MSGYWAMMPCGEHVGHVQDLVVDFVVVGDVGGVVALQVVDGFGEGVVEVVVHHRAHLGGWPVGGVGR